MNTFVIILLAVAAIVLALLLIAAFSRKTYKISREIVIEAPLDRVFDYIKLLKNQDNFNKWVMVEPGMQREFKGVDGTPGFIYAWSGKKAGAGEQEIKTVVDGKTLETEIRFTRPFAAIAQANMATEPVSSQKTKITWTNASAMKYPMNLMLPMIEKMLAKDMDKSLANLKAILERN